MTDSPVDRAIEEIRRVGLEVSTRAGDLDAHAHDEGWHPANRPLAVIYPKNTSEAAEAVRICSQWRISIVPFGAGTSLEGQVIPTAPTFTFNMSKMDRVLEICADDAFCVVQPGVTRTALNLALRDTGLFFPVDPGADATLGGMASTRASGTNAVRYGTMRDAIMGLEVVTPSGEVLRTGSRTRKSAAGLDLTALFVGAEGTLGLITELTVRLHGIPEAIATTVASFTDVEAAVRAVVSIMGAGLTVGKIELIDALYAKALRQFEGLNIPEAPLLLIEFSGAPSLVDSEAGLAAEIAAMHGATKIEKALNPEDRSRLWRARHRAYWAGLKLRPGARAVITDVCVPMSALATSIQDAQADLDQHGLVGPILGHVGDGNFHSTILVNPDDVDELHAAEAAHARIVARALAVGGTCTGEHGIGLGKRSFLRTEHGAAVGFMQVIKNAIDPMGIFNPNKML